MKHELMLMCFLAFCASCRHETQKEILIRKAQYFDSIGFKTFKGLSINIMREGKNSSYQVNKFDDYPYYAIFGLNPIPKIQKNFIQDTIDLNFIEKFKTLDCYYLVCKDSFVRIDCRINKFKYIMYRGTPFKRMYLPFDTARAISLDDNWSYFEFDPNKK